MDGRQGKADVLVTVDGDLLALQGQLRCEVVTADAVLTELQRWDSRRLRPATPLLSSGSE